MAWIESHQELGTHPKTRKLARLLEVSIPQAVGHLHCLWHWALNHAFDGDLTGYDFDDIAIGAMWDGDADTFVKALIEAKGRSGHGFIDQEAERITLHDWLERTAHLRARRESAQKANHIRWHSGRKVSDPSCEWCRTESDTSAESVTPPNGTKSESERTPPGAESESTEPDRTEPDLTEPKTHTRPADALADFERFWDLYPKRNGKRVGRAQAETIWKRLEPAEREEVFIAVEHYRKACDDGLTIAKDAHRWLGGKPRVFTEWLEPAVPDRPTNGHQPFVNPSKEDYLDPTI